MNKELQNRLKSQAGASLPLALLLFLVCAALSAVVLSAATASTGRLSELTNTDQRYYSVMSAAQLLRDELCSDDAVVTLTRKKNDGAYTAKAESPSDLGDLLLCRAVEDLAGASNTDDGAAAWQWEPGQGRTSGAAKSYTLSLEPKADVSSAIKSRLGKVNVVQNVDADGNMTFTLSQANSTGQTYAVSLSMAVSANTTEKRAANGQIVEKITKLKWDATGLRKSIV